MNGQGIRTHHLHYPDRAILSRRDELLSECVKQFFPKRSLGFGLVERQRTSVAIITGQYHAFFSYACS